MQAASRISLLFIALLLLWQAGCTTPAKRLARLQSEARNADELQLSVVRDQGRTTLHPLPAVPDGFHAVIPMVEGAVQPLFHSIVEVQLNGRNVKALVDTGSPFTFVGYKTARKAGLVPLRNPDAEPGQPALYITPLRGIGGESSQLLAFARELRIGTESIRGLPVGVLYGAQALGGMEWIGFHKVEMVVGNDLLSRFRKVVFDFPNNRILIDNSEQSFARSTVAEKSVALVHARPIPVAMGSLHQRPPVPMAIDTGSDGGLWLPRTLAEQLALREFRRVIAERAGRGFGGDTVYKQIAPRALNLGNLTVRGVPVTIEIAPQTESDMRYGLLGQKVLRRFKVTIDYENERVAFE